MKKPLTLDSKLAFGKHKGKSVRSIFEEDEQYLIWAADNVEGFKLEGQAESSLLEARRRLKKERGRTKVRIRSFFEQIARFDRKERKGNVDWKGPADFYLIVVDHWVKFGITSNWKKRQFFYSQQFGEMQWKVVKRVQHPTRWQAEFLEQMVAWQLTRFVTHGTREWVENLSAQNVWDCVEQTEQRIKEFGWHNYANIHLHGDNRWDYYKDTAMYEFDGHSESSIQLKDDSEAEEGDSLTI